MSDNQEYDITSGVDDAGLKAFVERIERLEEEKSALQDDIKEVYAELKGNGFIPKIVRAIIRKRKKDRAELQEEEALIDLYERALSVHA